MAGMGRFVTSNRRNSSPAFNPDGISGQLLGTSVCACAGVASNATNAENSTIASQCTVRGGTGRRMIDWS